jgi:phage baseplate assembly protein V
MSAALERQFRKMLAGVRSAFRAVAGAMVHSGRTQKISAEGLAGEQLPDMELLQQFGFTSAPPEGAHLIVLPLGGRTSASVVVATEHGAYRFQLGNRGEAAMYNQWGDHVWMRENRQIDVVAAAQVNIQSPLVNMSGDLVVQGDIVAGGDVADQGGAKTMAGMRSVYNGHHHGGSPTPDAGM